MMLAYQTPNVYFEHIDPPRQLRAMRMDIAGFVGIAAYGPLHRAVKIDSWNQFTAIFGAHIAQGYLAYAIEGFFANGGQTCYVVRAADPEFARKADLELIANDDSHKVRLTSNTEEELVVSVVTASDSRFTLSLRRSDGSQEVWRNLSMRSDDSRYVATVLNDQLTGSRILSVSGNSVEHWPPDLAQLRLGEKWYVSSGSGGLFALTPAHFTGVGAPPLVRWGLSLFDLVDEVNVVAIPDIMFKPYAVARQYTIPRRCQDLESMDPPQPPMSPELEFPPPFSDAQIEAMQQDLLNHCHLLKDRMALLDPRISDISPGDIAAWRRRFTSKYGALYFPWLLAPDPLQLDGLLRPVPPSGHVAGVYARLSFVQRNGQQAAAPSAPYRPTAGSFLPPVHIPPANEPLYAAQDVRMQVSNGDHGILNLGGVNVIRPYNGRGIRIAGARTMSDDTEYRFVNVRRLLLLISEVLDEQLQWTLFEANNQNLWLDLDRVVRSFLRQMWEHGMLDGGTADEAFSVLCDETTNTPYEIENGRLVCEIGLNLPWPAEFVVVRIGKTEGGVELIEEGT